MRENLFRSALDTILTVVFTLLLAWVAYRVARFVFVDARWAVVERNITNLIVGGFPRDQIWRLWAALFVLAAALGFGAGAIGVQRRREVAEGRAKPVGKGGLRRLGPLILLVGVLLWFAGSLEALLLVLAISAVGAVFNVLGRRTPQRLERYVPLLVLAGVVVAFLVVVAFGGVGWSLWGGFLLTVFLAVAAILLSFPFGVLLALGRRSSLPAVRAGLRRLHRALPRRAPDHDPVHGVLHHWLLPAGRGLGAEPRHARDHRLHPLHGRLRGGDRARRPAVGARRSDRGRPGARAFAAPHDVPHRAPPGAAGRDPRPRRQFISLYKDTSLVFILGLTELLAVAQNITKQPDFLAQGLFVETLVFASLVYWTGSYWMSRESQRLERRLGLGER